MKDTELTRKWIAALRSGSYKQGHYCLRTKVDSFCCLGVLCDLYSSDGWKKSDLNEYYYTGSLDFSASGIHNIIPPEEAMSQAGISPEEAGELIGMNDLESRSFKEIADFIEGTLQ